MKRLLLLGLAAMSLVPLSGCGDDDPAPPPARVASPPVAPIPATPPPSAPKPHQLTRAERRRLRREKREAARQKEQQEARAATPSTANPFPYAEESPENELAQLQRPGVDRSDPLLGQFAAQIDRMAARSERPADSSISLREGIARVTIMAHDKMAERGVDEDYLSILTHVNDAVPDGQQLGQHAADIFAAYIVLRAPKN